MARRCSRGHDGSLRPGGRTVRDTSSLPRPRGRARAPGAAGPPRGRAHGRPRQRARSTRSCRSSPGRPRARSSSGCTRRRTSTPSSRSAPAGGGRIDADTGAGRRVVGRRLLAAGAGLTPSRRSTGARPTPRSAPCGRPVTTPPRHAPWASAWSTTSPSPPRRWPTGASGSLIVDYDAHHGNGTQDIFYDRRPRALRVAPRVPAVPGHGRADRDRARAPASGTRSTCRCPPGATGDVYLPAIDDVVAPVVRRFDPTWLLLSAGFDAHRRDPLTGLGLSAGDFADLTERLAAHGAAGRRDRLPRGRLRPPGAGRLDRGRARAPSPASTCARRRRRRGGPAREVVDARGRERSVAGRPSIGSTHRSRASTVVPERFAPVLGRAPPLAERFARRRPSALPRRRHRARPARSGATITGDYRPHHRRPARPRSKRILVGLGRRRVDPGRALRHHRRPARRAEPTRSPPTGPRCTTPTPASPTSSSPTPSRPTCPAATSPSTPWRCALDARAARADRPLRRRRRPRRQAPAHAARARRVASATTRCGCCGRPASSPATASTPDAGPGRRGRGASRDRLEIVSAERIRDELDKLIVVDDPAAGLWFLRRHRAGRGVPARAAGDAPRAGPDPPPQGRAGPHDRRGRERAPATPRPDFDFRHAAGRAVPRRRQAQDPLVPRRQGRDVPPPRGGRRPHDARADAGAALLQRRHRAR